MDFQATLHTIGYVLLIFYAYRLFVSIYNGRIKRPVLKNFHRDFTESVSILIPVHGGQKAELNELIDDIKNLNYDHFEVIFWDERTRDGTRDILNDIVGADKRFKVIDSLRPPKNWTWKMWAGYNLADAAQNNVLVFMEPGIRIHRDLLWASLHYFRSNRVTILKIIPDLKTNNFAIWLVANLWQYIWLSFVPFQVKYKLRKSFPLPSRSKFYMVDAIVYKVGKYHKKAYYSLTPDIDITRRSKESGNTVRTLFANKSMSYRYFNSFTDGIGDTALEALSALHYRYWLMLLIGLIMILIPPFMIFFELWIPLGIAVLFIILSRIFTARIIRQNAFVTLIAHPLEMMLMPLILLSGLATRLTTKKPRKWKPSEEFD